jgi:hypothetical protein
MPELELLVEPPPCQEFPFTGCGRRLPLLYGLRRCTSASAGSLVAYKLAGLV